MNSEPSEEKFETLLDYLQRVRGFDFSGYRRPSLKRRVARRMQMLGLEEFGYYVDYLEVHPEEFSYLFNTILINVTSFFRDPPAWDFLARESIPRILSNKKEGDFIRVWSAGCASGEEAYSVAMLLGEAAGEEALRKQVKVYATDVDEDALSQARQGSYGVKEVQSIPADLKDKYFEKVGGRHVFRTDFRRSVIFGRHDLIQDAPISHLDLLVCRNTLMYFNAETQTRILSRFHFALSGNGYLFLGKAEMLLSHLNLYVPAELKHRIFCKVSQINMRERLLVLSQAGNPEYANQSAHQVSLRESAFDSSLLAQIVVDLNGNLVLANERARALFGVLPRDLGRPLQDLEISYRPVELRSLIEQAYTENRPVLLSNLKWTLSNQEVQYLDVQVVPVLGGGDTSLGVSVTFRDVTSLYQLQTELQRSKQELETAYEELQSTNEELETTNEELQSTVEELETTNEELQSSNEELETMNEELQSTNEELQTLNDEIRLRTEELNRANAFLESILSSVLTGVVVTDDDFSILIWNRRAEDMWGLRADEVKGQSLFNLDIGLPVEQLKAPIRACMMDAADGQAVVLDATNRRGKAIKCRVSCTRFINLDRPGPGAILLMEEMS